METTETDTAIKIIEVTEATDTHTTTETHTATETHDMNESHETHIANEATESHDFNEFNKFYEMQKFYEMHKFNKFYESIEVHDLNDSHDIHTATETDTAIEVVEVVEVVEATEIVETTDRIDIVDTEVTDTIKPIVSAATKDQPISFTAEAITASEASIQLYGSDLSSSPDELLIKLTLTADMANITDPNVFSITGAQLEFDIDWTQYEVIDYGVNGAAKFETASSINTSSIWESYGVNGLINNTLGNTDGISTLVVGSIDTSANPPKTLVDNVLSTGFGVDEKPSSLELGVIYLNPVDSIKKVDFSYSALVVTNEATSEFIQASQSVSINTTSIDAMIYTTEDELLDNLTLYFIKDGVDTGVSTLVEDGGITIDTNVEFNPAMLSSHTAYTDTLNISDMYGVLDNIAQIIDTYAEHAADMNNDGVINISDVYEVLNCIGQAPQNFDLVDTKGNLITNLNAETAEIANWTIVANGDVNMSGGFVDTYLVADIV